MGRVKKRKIQAKKSQIVTTSLKERGGSSEGVTVVAEEFNMETIVSVSGAELHMQDCQDIISNLN